MAKKIVYIDNFLITHGHTPTIGDTLSTLLAQEGFDIVKASSKESKLPRLFDMLKVIYQNRKNAIVLISTYSGDAFYFAYTCSLLCRLLNIKYIPCLHGGNLPDRINKSKKLSNHLFGNSYINIAVSGYLEEPIKQKGWPVMVIPNIIHTKDYPFLQRENVGKNILWVRSFHEIYNPKLAINILAAIQQKYPDVRLTMVGPDKDGSLEICKQYAKDLKVDTHIVFTGLLTRDEWVTLSKTHDLFINTTNFDNLPVSVIEAMALGLPVISTNVGGLKFLIKNEENGILIEPNNTQHFVDAIFNLINNKSLASSLSNNARKYSEQFDWIHVKNQWKQLLSNI